MPEPSAKEYHQKVDVGAQRIARVYAQALLDAADAAGQAATVLEQFDSLIEDVFQADPRLEVLLSSAAVGRLAREEVLRKMLEGRADPVFYNFLQTLNKHERLDLLRPILAAAHELDDQRNRRLRVLVSTAVPLADDFRERIAKQIRASFHLEPTLFEHVDPNLLGGMKLQIGDQVYDGTLRTRINTLKHQILERGSHEIQSRRDSLSSHEGN